MSQCLLCSRETAFLFATRDFARPDDPVEYRVNWCGSCDFGRIEGNFTPETVSELYPPTYYTHGKGDASLPILSFLERLRLHLAWRGDYGITFHPSELPPRSSICDVGCGAGDNLRRFRQSGYSTTVGIDPDASARCRAADAGVILEGTAESLPAELDGRKFDAVLMSHVLEHCIDPALAIANAKTLLADDGTLVIEIPNSAAAGFATFKELWPWSDVPRHLNFFTWRSLTKLIEESGLSISKVQYTGYARQFMASWVSTQNLIWNATRDGPSPNFDVAAWSLLLRTFLSAPAHKYDSIRVHARGGRNAPVVTKN